jgi:hypothetical protein
VSVKYDFSTESPSKTRRVLVQSPTVAPQSDKTLCKHDAGFAGARVNVLTFASRRWLCVRRVARPISRLGLDIFVQMCVLPIRRLAQTACPLVGAVFESWTANDPMRRQLPLCCSKDQSHY